MCNTVIVKVVIIQIWPIWIIQIKRFKTGKQLCSYHNEDRKVPGKHGGIKSSVLLVIMKNQSYIYKFYDNFLSLHKTPKQVFYWILKIYPMFVRMLTVIRIMLISSLFVRKNMLRSYLTLNFIFGTNTNEYKGRCVFVYLQEGKNHEKTASPRCF